MKHSEYIRQAKKRLTALDQDRTSPATTELRVAELFYRTEWSREQCVNLVDEIEGRRVYQKRGSFDISHPDFFSSLFGSGS